MLKSIVKKIGLLSAMLVGVSACGSNAPTIPPGTYTAGVILGVDVPVMDAGAKVFAADSVGLLTLTVADSGSVTGTLTFFEPIPPPTSVKALPDLDSVITYDVTGDVDGLDLSVTAADLPDSTTVTFSGTLSDKGVLNGTLTSSGGPTDYVGYIIGAADGVNTEFACGGYGVSGGAPGGGYAVYLMTDNILHALFAGDGLHGTMEAELSDFNPDNVYCLHSVEGCAHGVGTIDATVDYGSTTSEQFQTTIIAGAPDADIYDSKYLSVYGSGYSDSYAIEWGGSTGSCFPE